MEKRQDLGIPYGVADFKTIRTEGLYYVDKTEYLARLEARDRFVFVVRPRRFGKSLFLDMLRLYYDRNEKENFETLFGGLWIGSPSTPNSPQRPKRALPSCVAMRTIPSSPTSLKTRPCILSSSSSRARTSSGWRKSRVDLCRPWLLGILTRS